MNSYNGFSPQQRNKALKYHKKQIADGHKPPHPDACDGCGVTTGFLSWHSEDYSEPFGDHIGEFGVCYICHMQIHCRFRNRNAFLEYASLIEDGWFYDSFAKPHWWHFKSMFLHPNGEKPELFLRVQPLDNSLILRLNENDAAYQHHVGGNGRR